MARIEPQDPEQALAKEESYAKLLLDLLRKVMSAAARALGLDTDPAVSKATVNVPAGADLMPAPTQEAMAQEDIAIIPALWTAQAAAVLIPELSAVYEGQANHVLAGMVNAFPDLSVIPQVSDEFAEQRLAGAHNRLVGIGDMLWESARAQLSEGFALGEGFDKLRDRVQAAAGVTAARAERIARTEVIAASNAGSIDQVRFAGLVGTKTWLATPDERTRCTHHKADGQTVNLDDKFTLGGFGPDADPGCADVGVSYADYPGDPELPASEAVNCRCTLIFDVEPGTLLAAAANMNDQQLSDQQVDDYADPNPIGGARMPWHIVEDSAQCPAARPFAVVKDATGEVEGCHPTRGAATKQLDALYAAEQRMHTVPAEQAPMECPEGHHRMPDGSCMPDDQMPTQNPGYAAVQRWEGTLAIEGVETGDGRMFSPESLTWRDLPVPLMYQKVTSHGGVDDVTVNVGAIDEIWRDGNLIWGRGRIDMEDPNGVEVARKMRHGYLRGVSIDADSIKDADVELVWPGGTAASDDMDIMQLMGAAPELTIYNRGRISAATMVNIPAFAEASLMLVDADTGALVAAGAEVTPEELDKITPEITPTSGRTAAAFSFAAVRSHESATSGDSWDAATEERRLPSPMTVTVGRQFYAWIDDAEVSDGHIPKAAGKFGHHMVNADGRPGAANLAACSAGIGSLHGARNEPDIPEKDLRGVYNHLRQHLIDGGRDPDSIPEFGAAPLTASSYVIEIPDLPPASFFEEPAELPPIGAMWVTAQGRLFGLVGPGDTAHRSFRDRRVTIPMGNVDYNAWMNRPTLVQGGKRVATGVITMNCGHASPFGPRDPGERMKHYDDSCSIAAVVAVGESKRFNAPWVSGVLMPMDAEQVQRFMACQLSGDWAPHRERPGWREFVAALAVPVPGFARATTARVVDDVLVSSAVPILPWRDLQPQPATGPLPDSHRHQLDRLRGRFGLSNRAQIGAIMERLRARGGSPRAPRPPVAGDGEDKEGHGASSTRVVFHLPGKHPQEDHGRDGAGLPDGMSTGMPSEIVSAKIKSRGNEVGVGASSKSPGDVTLGMGGRQVELTPSEVDEFRRLTVDGQYNNEDAAGEDGVFRVIRRTRGHDGVESEFLVSFRPVPGKLVTETGEEISSYDEAPEDEEVYVAEFDFLLDEDIDKDFGDQPTTRIALKDLDQLNRKGIIQALQRSASARRVDTGNGPTDVYAPRGGAVGLRMKDDDGNPTEVILNVRDYRRLKSAMDAVLYGEDEEDADVVVDDPYEQREDEVVVDTSGGPVAVRFKGRRNPHTDDWEGSLTLLPDEGPWSVAVDGEKIREFTDVYDTNGRAAGISAD